MAKQYIGYVGTYTRESSEGIYRFILDAESGKLEGPEVAAKVGSPTYVSIRGDKEFLYSVAQEEKLGGVAAYRIQKDSGELELLNVEVVEGAPPCHLEAHEQKVVTGNYHKGEIVLHHVDEQGAIQTAEDVVVHEGQGPHARQEKSHVHYTGYTPDQKYIVVADLGTDEVVTYEEVDGKLDRKQTFNVKPGSGPRHITFHPNGKWAYVITELSTEVIVLDYDATTGRFTEKQTALAKPEDFSETNDASAIHISPDGRYLYTGNRGHNSIAVFRINGDDGLVELVEFTPTGGEWPRDFVLDPSGAFIIAANQHTGNLVLFSRDSDTGKLTQLDSEISVPEAVCVKFL